MNVLSKMIREPLLHFLLLGGGVFLLFGMTTAGTIEKPNQIVVSQGQLELLSANFASTWQRSPSNEEMQDLIDKYLRDEVYYREALALGLDEDDTVIRRRLRQKLGIILEDTAALLDPDDQELAAYMNEHAESFRIQPEVSFRQVYLSFEKRRDVNADASAILERLKSGQDPQLLGDPIMLADRYALVSQNEIKQRFGKGFAQQLLAVAPGEWAGPLTSGFGGHLVLITEIKPARMPELAEVKQKVKNEWLLLRTEELKLSTYRKLLENYEVVMPEYLGSLDITSVDLASNERAHTDAQSGKELR